MLLVLLLGGLFNSAIQGQLSFDECQAQEFKPKSCWNSEQFYKLGKFGCQIQGKKYLGKAPGNNNGCEK